MIIHENIMGQPDNYGSKTLLFVIFAISFLLFIMFQIIRKYPEKFNYPFFNEKYKELIYVKSQNLIDYLKIITGLLFLVVILKFTVFYNVSNKLLQGLLYSLIVLPFFVLGFYIRDLFKISEKE